MLGLEPSRDKTVFSNFPRKLIKNLTKSLVKNLAKNLAKNLVKNLAKNLARQTKNTSGRSMSEVFRLKALFNLFE